MPTDEAQQFMTTAAATRRCRADRNQPILIRYFPG